MRLGRILVASLAPIISLSAWASGIGVPPADRAEHASQQYSMNSLVRLLAQLVAPPADCAVTRASGQKPPANAFLPLAALAHAPLGHSLWMLHPAAVLPPRAPSRLVSPLRC